MKAALIPPRGYYNSALQSDYHLMLAQIIDPDYVDLYDARVGDNFVIMDNGAAEGTMVRDVVLLTRAARMCVDEVVLPDVMCNAEATIARSKEFWTTVDVLDNRDVINRSQFSYMGVVQSQGSLGELIQCVEAFTEMDQVSTLGIPRHLVDKDKYARANFLSWLRGHGYNERFEVHLLGTNRLWPQEVSFVAQEHSWVRGVDSSLPYNYAIAGVELNSKFVSNGGIVRPEEYFDTVRKIDTELLQTNIDTFMRWASGTEGTQG